MEFDPKTREYSCSSVKYRILTWTAQYLTSDKSSFASVSAKDRWPVIIVSLRQTIESRRINC